MCSPEVSGHVMELETGYGVPAVGVHADAFVRLVESVSRANGQPRARRAFVPTPVTTKTAAELRDYIEGVDPVSGRPFVDQVFAERTAPLEADDLRGVATDRSTPRLVDEDTEDNLQKLFRDLGWTDYLPVTLPTEERVARMLEGTSHAPDETVGRMRPTGYRELW